MMTVGPREAHDRKADKLASKGRESKTQKKEHPRLKTWKGGKELGRTTVRKTWV